MPHVALIYFGYASPFRITNFTLEVTYLDDES